MSSVDYQVSADLDDGNFLNSGGTLDYDKNPMYIGSKSSTVYNIWARWSGVTMPENVTITTAWVSLRRFGSFGTPAASKIYFEDAANPAAPKSLVDVRDNRTKTGAYVEWSPPTTAGTWSNSPDIKSIIQELVDNYSYESGAAMMMLFMGVGSGDNYATFTSHEGATGYAPKLHIEYELKKSFVLPRRRRMDAMVVR